MTRKEEATNKIVELIDIVKDVPKNESILAVGMDMVEWADKTMLDRVCKWLENHNDYQRVHDNGSGVRFDMTQCIFDLRKAMEE